MAQNDMELENEGSAGKFERFLFLMIPIIFTLVLIGVLLALFNMDYRNDMLQIANKIPVVNKWIPDPKGEPSEDSQSAEEQAASSEATIKELKTQLSQQAETVKQLNEQKTAQDKQVEALKSQIGDMQQAASSQQPVETEDEHQKQIVAMTKLYAGMKASKAAAIMQNMTTEEVVQLLSGMNNDSKTAILEKMDPKIAADVSVKLKESANSSDMAIAALQSRLKQDSAATAAPTGSSANLDKQKLSQTFSSMPATEAAKLLSEMYPISPDKVITILSTVDDSVRSGILSEMTKNDTNGVAAKVMNRLMGGK
ncbi:kinesin [Paenibacillus sp. 7124]|uniref:Kinesin n=1 Tax=Paenibacillus apii TaxID=1850370 RepID=A0A6M1PLE1_9BACL|nr:kinesin [Paenibacillus apii]NGM81151.1 kinesin [Paenibacillus apii]NJJ37771.1 kinesin [Paenibacillus apii]